MILRMIRWISCWLSLMVFTHSLLAENQVRNAEALYLEARRLALGEGCEIDIMRARELYQKAADSGDPRALAWKARNIFLGVHGFSKDEAEARRIFQAIEPRLREMGLKNEEDAWGSLCRTMATIDPKIRGQEAFEMAKRNATAGKPNDLATLGRFYREGIGVERDLKTAVSFYLQAAEQGDKMAPAKLGYCHACGVGVEKDSAKALDWYRKGAEMGEGDAIGGVGWCYEKGNGVTKDEKEAVKWYTKAAEKGNSWALYKLGNCFANGIGVAKDPVRAVDFYRKGAEMGDSDAIGGLGYCYEKGYGVTKDEKEAVKCYVKAAEKGSGWVQNKLGYCYAHGIGVERDYGRALDWYHQGSENENADAMGNMGWCYEKGNGVPKDEKEAVKWYKRAAEKGSGWAMGKLACMQEEGRGTDKNPSEAFQWWNRQAEAGDFWAPENVARCHANGIGTPKNPEEAVKWYGKVRAKLEEETRKNEAWAWDNLGRFYFNGLGVQKDYAKALECYHKAADLKSGWAMEQIGWCYDEGKGVAKDEKEALRWYLQAADNGQAWSMAQCAINYENGRGTEKDPTKSFEFYVKAAQAGNVWAQNALGNCYFNGFGVGRDPAKAFEWYGKAAVQGNRGALENLARCYSQGMGVEKDDSKALDYLQQAGERGSAWAQAETGRYFTEGIGTKKDKKIALDWFRKSADQGNAFAQSWVGYAAENGWEQIPDVEDAMQWYRKSAEGGHAWSWAALGACLLKKGTFYDPLEAVRCFRKANWAGDAWGTRLLADAYAKGRGVTRDPDLAASLYKRVVNTSEGPKAREALVDLHWGGKDHWKNANLESGMDHWLVLNSNPSVRVREIYATVKRLLEEGKPGSVAEVLDLFEQKQKQAAQPFPANLRVFRAGCRLMADRHVPEAWASAIPTWFEPWDKRLRPYLKEKNGGNAAFSTGTLEIHQTSAAQNYSPVMWLVEAWQNHVQWLFGLWAEEESGWYRSFVRSIKAVDRPVNLRWLEAGVSRKEEAWRDVEEVPLDQLSLPAVGGVMIVSRLQENPKRSKDLINRLAKLEGEEKERQKKELAGKTSGKQNKEEKGLPDVYQQVHDLAESGLVSSRWWKEKGEISFGFGFSCSDLGRGTSPLTWESLPIIETVLGRWYRGLFSLFIQARPDLVLRLGNLSETIFADPSYNLTAYAYLLDRAYEAVAEKVPSRREEAIQALSRWNQARGNAVTADRWQAMVQKESLPQKEKTEKPVEKSNKSGDGANIPKEFKENAARATRLYAAGKWEEAILEYQAILKKYPDSIFALSNIGVVRFQQKEYAEAEKALREALRQSPNDAFSVSVLGVVLLQQEKVDEAEDFLKQASRLDSNDAKTWNYLGIAHFKKGRREESIRCTTRALEVDPEYGDAHFNLAVLYAGGTSEEKKLARTHYQLARGFQVPADPNLEKTLR